MVEVEHLFRKGEAREVFCLRRPASMLLPGFPSCQFDTFLSLELFSKNVLQSWSLGSWLNFLTCSLSCSVSTGKVGSLLVGFGMVLFFSVPSFSFLLADVGSVCLHFSGIKANTRLTLGCALNEFFLILQRRLVPLCLCFLSFLVIFSKTVFAVCLFYD